MTPWTEIPRLAALYDTNCAGREDHDFYLALANRCLATAVVDIGCGTGVFAVDATVDSRGNARTVVGVDPARPMLDIARARPGGDRVTWIQGTAADVPAASADFVIMMGHVAQYFVSDAAWAAVLQESHRILQPGGTLAFEVRNPERGWPDRWTKERTKSTQPHPDGGEFTSWVEIINVNGPPESFVMTHEGNNHLPNGDHLSAQETLRFRSPAEVVESLHAAGLDLSETWGDWDGSPFNLATSNEFIIAANPV